MTETDKTLWVAGHVILENSGVATWDILGVFDTEDKAVKACYDIRCFVGPIILNDNVGQPVEPWPGAYYPKAEDEDRRNP